MRIHLNLGYVEARDTVSAACRAASVYPERLTTHKSRTHQIAVDVILSGESPHRINSAEFGHEQAATWDQWGIFLAAIYAVDPTAKSWAYADAAAFHSQTGHRFNLERDNPVDSITHPDYRRTSHRWSVDREAPYPVWRCKGHGKDNPTCSAVLNYPEVSA